MGERKINPKFNVNKIYKNVNIINPYRFSGGGGGGSSPDFIMTWETTTSSENIVLPLNTSYTYDIIVDWGDETSTTSFSGLGSQTALNHTYATAGTYTVTVTPNTTNGWKGMSKTNFSTVNQLKDITQWGNSELQSFSFTFYNNMDISATDYPILTSVTSLSNSFRNCDGFSTVLDVSNWDVSSVTDMSFMFRDAVTSGITGMANWNTSSLTSCSNMFSESNGALNEDLSGWDISGITNFTNFNNLSFVSSSWSPANYDATLIGWASQTPKTGVSFSADNTTTRTSASASAYTTLTSTYSWTITDGGEV